MTALPTPLIVRGRSDSRSRLLDPVGRAIGRCTVLYRDGEPVEVGYWGCTAD